MSMHGFFAWLSTWVCLQCSQWQSVLQPGGPVAARLEWLLWVFIAICGVIWLLVMLVLATAIWRRHKPDRPPLERDAGHERVSTIIVGIAVTVTVLIIGGLTFLSYAATRSISGKADYALVVRLRGYQWWWQVTYANPDPAKTFQTANEIHIPVGKPVRFELSSADVIHSFWVPNLLGKQDLIPGRNNQVTLIADHPGLYRGQCAEFCGLQHAHMALLVIAEDPAAFQAWRNGQVQPAASSRESDAATGRQFVTSHTCAACHTVRGTAAAGTLGPDLTHVASRLYIAAGLLPTTRGSLAAWIVDPQTIKPGNNMPMVPMSANDVTSVSAYLATLK
jgi:cytochrome c oxidase subunit II